MFDQNWKKKLKKVKISVPKAKKKKKVCHMSANTYQVRFYHFRYQSVVSNKIFDFRTCGTQN